MTEVSKNLGDKPSLMWVPMDKIMVDHNYQREIKPARVAQILRDFNWAHFQPVMLAQHDDGTFSVFDGQHRVAAARAHPGVTEIPAAVVCLSGVKDEAGAFLGVNVNRTNVSTIEKFWAGVEAGDAAMLAVCSVLKAAGCEVVQAHGLIGANKTHAVCAVSRSIQRYGDAAVISSCKAIVAAWPKDNASLNGVVIQALARLYRNNKDIISDERMITKLSARNRQTLSSEAESIRKLSGGDAGLALAKAMIEIYNRGLHVNQISIGAVK